MMKRIVFMALAALMALNIFAQEQQQERRPRFEPREFQRRMQAELTRQACLTPEEANAFFPIYREMKEKQRGIAGQIHKLKKECNQEDAASCEATIAKIKQLQLESVQMEQNYYRRMVETVSACKVFKVIKAEDDFHRRMVQGQRSRQHRGQKDGDAPGQGRQRPENP